MHAIVQREYGSPDTLRFEEVDKPEAGDDQVLIRAHATSANPYDWHFMRGMPYVMRLAGSGVRKPKHSILGYDLAGEVEAVGKDVTRFKPGDEVYAQAGMGSFAEYVAVPEEFVSPKPVNLSYEQAATVPLAGVTALQGVRDAGKLQPGQKILIIGASGGVGTFAVQIAKVLGANVTGVCSTRNVALVRSIGADHVIDYTKEDFARGVQKYDVIFQVAGETSPSACRRALTPNGRLVMSSGDSKGRWIGPVDRIVKATVQSPFVSQKLITFVAKRSREDLEHLTELIEDGRVTPVIDRSYPLAGIPEAIRYVETGHARGKVVITVNGHAGT